MFHEVEERRLRPVDVVKHDDQRASSAECLEEQAYRIEVLLDPCSRLGHADDLEHTLSDELGIGCLVFDELDESGSVLLHGRTVVELGHVLECFQEGPERDPLAVWETPTACDERSLGNVLQELLDEPRLPDARRPENREQLAGAVADRLLEGVVQASTLSLAAHHRRRETSALALCRLSGSRVASSMVASPGAPSRASLAATVSGSPVARS